METTHHTHESRTLRVRHATGLSPAGASTCIIKNIMGGYNLVLFDSTRIMSNGRSLTLFVQSYATRSNARRALRSGAFMRAAEKYGDAF